ncbi:MAG: urease accessory protein UreE [Oxalobacteraceae bacterium]|nr:MAG: urease accessory protein UreE [Oxalobacteraceae bacterium]
MLTLHTRIDAADHIAGELLLPYELREKSRLRATLTSGEEVAIFTVRGTVLRNGDLLRCAFHLGNRHTQAQVGEGFLRIRRDSVLKDMLQGLGATVTEEDAPFEPESGAYGGGHGHHGDDGHHPLAPIPLRQRIHRPGDKAP